MGKIISTPCNEEERFQALDNVMEMMRATCRKAYGAEYGKRTPTGEKRFLQHVRKIAEACDTENGWPWPLENKEAKAFYIVDKFEHIIMDGYDEIMMDYLPENRTGYLFIDALRYISGINNFDDTIKNGFEIYKNITVKYLKVEPNDILFEKISTFCNENIQKFNTMYNSDKSKIINNITADFLLMLENEEKTYFDLGRYFDENKEYSDKDICEILGKYIFNERHIEENADMPQAPQGMRKILSEIYRCLDFELVGERVRANYGLKEKDDSSVRLISH